MTWIIPVALAALALIAICIWCMRHKSPRAPSPPRNAVCLYTATRDDIFSAEMPYELVVEMTLALGLLYKDRSRAQDWARKLSTPDQGLIVVAVHVNAQMLRELMSDRDQEPLVLLDEEGRHIITQEALPFLVSEATIKPVWTPLARRDVHGYFQEMLDARDENRAGNNKQTIARQIGWQEYCHVKAKQERGEMLSDDEEDTLARPDLG